MGVSTRFDYIILCRGSINNFTFNLSRCLESHAKQPYRHLDKLNAILVIYYLVLTQSKLKFSLPNKAKQVMLGDDFDSNS